MPFTNYTIVPSDGVVVIDGQAALGVDMSGIAADVHAIQWYGVRGSGVIEYEVNSTTGELPAPGSFTDADAYLAQTTEAEAIINAANNPITYYSTVDGNVYQGITYNLGDGIVISTPNTAQPFQTTTLVPGTPISPYQDLYWYNNAWVVSSVDPTLSLSEAKTLLNNAVAYYGALEVSTQTRIYSPIQLHTTPDVNLLSSADYPGLSLGDYQSYIDGEVSLLQGLVNAATSVSQLYSFNPLVNGDPNS